MQVRGWRAPGLPERLVDRLHQGEITPAEFTARIKEFEVRFYRANERPYGAFSNLARFPVEFEGRVYPTSEHAYQAAKPRDPRVREWLLAAPSPALLAKTAHQLTRPWEVASGWAKGKVARMRAILKAKFAQHEDLAKLLLETGNKRLVESGTIDDAAGRFWGEVVEVDRAGDIVRVLGGKNTLGQLLMEVRAELRSLALRDYKFAGTCESHGLVFVTRLERRQHMMVVHKRKMSKTLEEAVAS